MTELDALANVDFATREVKPEHKALNILRIGTSGALHADIPLGSYILSHYSVGFDGVMNWYAHRDQVTIPEVEEAFKAHMNWEKTLQSPYFVKASDKIVDLMKDVTVPGVTISAPGFYGPQGRVVRIPLAMPDMLERIESFRFEAGGMERRITNFEMESAPLAGLCTLLGHNACTVCCAIANRYLQSSNPDYKPFIRRLAEIAVDRMRNPQVTPTVSTPAPIPVCMSTLESPTYRTSSFVAPATCMHRSTIPGSGLMGKPSRWPRTVTQPNFPKKWPTTVSAPS